MAKKFNILISSAGRRVRLVQIFRDALKSLELEGKVVACDMSRLSSAMHYADAGFVVPKCLEPSFVDEMLALCIREQIDLVVPTIDTELGVYAENRDRFAKIGTRVAVSDPATIAMSADKVLTHEWLVTNSIPTVRQDSVENVLSALQHWEFPLVAKPRGGSASIGVFRIESPRELERLVGVDGYIVQECAPGKEHTVDFLVGKGGKLVDCILRQRLEVRAGEVSKAITVRVAKLVEMTRKIAESLPGAYGCLNVQIFWDAKGAVGRVIELNPRFGGGFPLSWAAGALFPKWLIEDIVGLDSSASFGGWREHVAMLRYDDEMIVENALGLLP